MFLFHVETNAFLHRVTSYNRKSEILGKADCACGTCMEADTAVS